MPSTISRASWSPNATRTVGSAAATRTATSITPISRRHACRRSAGSHYPRQRQPTSRDSATGTDWIWFTSAALRSVSPAQWKTAGGSRSNRSCRNSKRIARLTAVTPRPRPRDTVPRTPATLRGWHTSDGRAVCLNRRPWHAVSSPSKSRAEATPMPTERKPESSQPALRRVLC